MNKVTSRKNLAIHAAGLAFVLGGLWLTSGEQSAPPATQSFEPFPSTGQPAHRFPVKDVSLDEARALIAAGALVIDVREKSVSAAAHLPGAALIPIGILLAQLQTMEVAKTQQIVVYCGKGSTLGPEAAHILTQAGYTEVVNLAPGLSGWRDAGLPVQSS